MAHRPAPHRRPTRDAPRTVPRGPFWLYRPRGAGETLLYLGKSNRPDLRIEQHRDKLWYREVERWDVNLAERYETEDQVLRAEAAAIRAERPLFNIEHNEGNPGRVNPHTMRYMDGRPYRPDLYSDIHSGRRRPPRRQTQVARRSTPGAFILAGDAKFKLLFVALATLIGWASVGLPLTVLLWIVASAIWHRIKHPPTHRRGRR